ncbi:MAG: serine acetyltransferase [Clostridia bacterium]|nr:serine acetyltransferase [Clostridia bacterium]
MFDSKKIVAQMARSYQEEMTPNAKGEFNLPDRNEIIGVLEDLRKLMFPAYFAAEGLRDPAHFAESMLHSVYFRLKKQIEKAYAFCKEKGGCNEYSAERTTDEFVEELPRIRNILLTDVEAFFSGDPAARSKEEIIFSYPGFYAIFVYRLAHILYLQGVPFIPRMMTEYAHGATGIDINPGASIGEYFFIDHGTGVVIGETTVIGNRVKIYQAVTLGALSPRKGQKLAGVKRHPTVKDDVTVYSGASILGGETVIGEGAVIGGNCFLTESVAAGARVSAKQPELIIK